MLRVVEIFGLLGVALSIPATRQPTLQAIPSPAVHAANEEPSSLPGPIDRHVGPAVPKDLTYDAEEIAKLATSICSQGCEGIPEGSFWSWDAPLTLERGKTCSGKPGGEDRHCSNEPGDMAKKQFDSLVQKLGLNKFSTLAVVGSSGSLKYASHGEEIDAHDVVVRINGAPSADTGWTADIQAIGNRTDMAFVTPGGIVAFASPGGHAPKPTAVVFWAPPDICASDEVRRAHGTFAQSVVSADGVASGVWTVDADFACNLWNEELGAMIAHWPSTGMGAVAFIVKLAQFLGTKAPSVFGFGGNTRGCQKYYDCGAGGASYGDYHDMDYEHQTLSRWDQEGHIHLYVDL